MKIRLPSNERVMRVACYLALVGLVLMIWSVFDPTVWPIMLAISLDQAIGTLSFLLFLIVVARDLHLARALRKTPVEKEDQQPPATSDFEFPEHR